MAIQEHAYYGSFGYHVTNFFAVSPLLWGAFSLFFSLAALSFFSAFFFSASFLFLIIIRVLRYDAGLLTLTKTRITTSQKPMGKN